ncbi:hypothetical protein L207DRAFT_576985 [Hyaloscypha variabilis F]|uniref:Uncharacterized protein n=1 Tax=Hyaloscypha variabilis (strain UAMH 11265 / GT02V1 / F) TaxID=1149755 RepID=A0A2J6S5S0_HYAVF|nr:hypothetical protein L207DRAFT_576985 [Hyaloscypha variabilis F]
MSNYLDSKLIQSTSTFYTALGSRNPRVNSRPNSYENGSVPSHTIKVIQHLRQERNFDPRSTDSKHPSAPSLLPRLEYALAVKKVEIESAEESSNISSLPAQVSDGGARGGLLPLQNLLPVTKYRTPHLETKKESEHMVPMPRSVTRTARYISSRLALQLNPSDIVFLDSEPIDQNISED